MSDLPARIQEIMRSFDERVAAAGRPPAFEAGLAGHTAPVIRREEDLDVEGPR